MKQFDVGPEEYFEGIVHGDLNGANILIDSQEIVFLIDFAFSRRCHILRDIAKMESCVLIEYTPISSKADLKSMCALVDDLANVRDLSREFRTETFIAAQATVEQAYTADVVRTLRKYASHYIAGDPDPIQMSFAMLHYSLRSLHFTDISDMQKEVAVHMCKRYALNILNAVTQNGGVSMKKSSAPGSDVASLRLRRMNTVSALSGKEYEYEKRKYFHNVLVKESFVVDVITRNKVNIMKNCVALQYVEGSSKTDVLSISQEVDEMQSKRRHQRRWDMVKAAAARSHVKPLARRGSFRTSHRDQRFTTSTQMLDIRKTPMLCILGGAASGKSCLLRRMLVMAAQEQQGRKDDLVPCLILLIDLGRLMSAEKLTDKDDLLQAYISHVYGENSARCAFLLRAREIGQLVVLFDGLDEAGAHKESIESYIARICKEENIRVTVSSRITGFNDKIFESFRFVQVLPLTEMSQEQIISSRLGNDHPRLKYVKSELKKPEYAEISKNPLMLTLLISLLSKSKSGEGTSQSYSRPDLYQHAVAQLLHKSSLVKFGNRRDATAQSVEEIMTVLAKPECENFLKSVAYQSQTKRLRDISSRALVTAKESHVKDSVYFGLFKASSRSKRPEDFEKAIENVVTRLQEAVLGNLCGLFVTSDINDNVNPTMRFVHHSFQEFLSAQYIVDHMDATEMRAIELLSEDAKSLDFQRLHDSWWQQVVLGVGGSLNDATLPHFLSAIVAQDDDSGANIILAYKLLDAAFRNFRVQQKTEVKERMKLKEAFSKHRKAESVISLLMHPSVHLRNLALLEVAHFSEAKVAMRKLLKLSNLRDKAWHVRYHALQSIAMLDCRENVWTDEIANALYAFVKDPLDVIREQAFIAIKAQNLQNHHAIVNNVLNDLSGDAASVENALELVSALHINQSPPIVAKILELASASSWHSFAEECLYTLTPDENITKELIVHLKQGSSCEVRKVALRALFQNGISSAVIRHAALVSNAMSSWLSEDDQKKKLSALKQIARYDLSFGNLIKTMKSQCKVIIAAENPDIAVLRAMLHVLECTSAVNDKEFLKSLYTFACSTHIDKHAVQEILRYLVAVGERHYRNADEKTQASAYDSWASTKMTGANVESVMHIFTAFLALGSLCKNASSRVVSTIQLCERAIGIVLSCPPHFDVAKRKGWTLHDVIGGDSPALTLHNLVGALHGAISEMAHVPWDRATQACIIALGKIHVVSSDFGDDDTISRYRKAFLSAFDHHADLNGAQLILILPRLPRSALKTCRERVFRKI